MTKKRVWFPGASYHIMNRGNRKEKIFLDKNDYLNYLSILDKTRYKMSYSLYSYCLMPNHLHLQIKTEEVSISKIMHAINTNYVRYFNARHNFCGRLFQSRYKAKLIKSTHYNIQANRYIHRNPVEAGIVKSPENYRWSSYYIYLDYPDIPLDFMVNPELILKYFPENPRDNYIAYISPEDEPELTLSTQGQTDRPDRPIITSTPYPPPHF